MHFTSIAMAALVGVTQAVDVQVVYVGMNPVNDVVANKYWPEKVTAAPGTMVQFQFWAGNHTITQSNFDTPCAPITQTANGTEVAAIKSGFIPVEASADETGEGTIATYSVLINDTSPLWFYCGQGPHCAGGMAMVINENTESEKTLDAYKTNAAAAAGGDAPADGAPGAGDDEAGGDESENGAGGDAPLPETPGSDAPAGGDGESSEEEIPGQIPSNPDSSVGDNDGPPPSAASMVSLSWTVLLAAAIMFAL